MIDFWLRTLSSRRWSHHSPTRKVPPSAFRRPSVTKVWTMRTATNLHVLDCSIACTHGTVILDLRGQHAKPRAAAADALGWQRVHGGYQAGLV